MIGVRPHESGVPDHLRKELRALKSGPVPAWPRIGQVLDDADSWGYWETEGAASFTQWLRSLAHSLGRKERIFWRYLSAARYYKQLQEQLKQRKFDAPTLTELPDGVSPENLELLSKLSRVAPEEVLEPLARRVVEGKISRAELNRAWQAFRPALGGRTARGRGAVKPRLDRKDPRQFERQLKATVCHWLQVIDPRWTGCKYPDSYEVFLQVQPEPVPDRAFSYVFDAVAVVRRQEGPVELHGVEVIGMFSNESLQLKLSQAAEYCDYLWVAWNEEAGSVNSSRIPESIGLLEDRGGWTVVERRAKRTSQSGRYRENLLAGLLARAIRR